MLAHAATSADETLSIVMLFSALWIGWAGWSRLKGRGFPRLPMGGAYALIAFALTLAVAAAIVPRAIFGTPNQAQITPGDGVRPASTATIRFLQPAPDHVVSGSTLDVALSLQGGTIVDAASTNLTPDTGHVHLSLDGRLVSMTYGLVQQIGLQGLSPGSHTLTAEFVAADHGPFDPRVVSSVDFQIPKAAS
jgi:hypothetical protein